MGIAFAQSRMAAPVVPFQYPFNAVVPIHVPILFLALLLNQASGRTLQDNSDRLDTGRGLLSCYHEAEAHRCRICRVTGKNEKNRFVT